MSFPQVENRNDVSPDDWDPWLPDEQAVAANSIATAIVALIAVFHGVVLAWVVR